MKKMLFVVSLLLLPLWLKAQVGSHRNELAVGLNGGYMLSNVGFMPKVTQGLHGGLTGGVSIRYVSEKYFNTICSIYAEVNYAQAGWKEKIVDLNDRAVINPETGLAEQYSRTIDYVQIPVFAHLAWGREDRGMQFFFRLGPQFGLMLGERTAMNFDRSKANLQDRANREMTQYGMPVENKFDYGIVGGGGIEYIVPRVGHFLLDARYYYGLANIYGSTKRDYFAKSNLTNIVVKLTYLFDITKTHHKK